MDAEYRKAFSLYLVLLNIRTNKLSEIANAITLTGDSIHDMAQALIVIGDSYNYEASKMATITATLNLYLLGMKSSQPSSKEESTHSIISEQKKWVEKQIKDIKINEKLLKQQTKKQILDLQKQINSLQKQIEDIRKLMENDDT